MIVVNRIWSIMMSFIILYIIIENHKITFHGFIHFNYTQSGNVKRYEGPGLYLLSYKVSKDNYNTKNGTGVVINGNVPIIDYNLITSIDPGTIGQCEYSFEDPKYPNNRNLGNSYLYLSSKSKVPDSSSPIILCTQYSCFLDNTYQNVESNLLYFNYKVHYEFESPKPSTLYLKITCSNEIIINNTICRSSNYITIFEDSYGSDITNTVTIGVNNNHSDGSFDIIIKDNLGSVYNNIIDYGIIYRGKKYSIKDKDYTYNAMDISKYNYSRHIVGQIYTTSGLDYTFNTNDWDSNVIISPGLKINGEYIPEGEIIEFYCILSYDSYNYTIYVDMNYV